MTCDVLKCDEIALQIQIMYYMMYCNKIHQNV